MKRKGQLVVAALACVLLAGAVLGFCVPQKTVIDQVCRCTSALAGQPDVDVILDGTYYRYLLRDDHFIGTIHVVGYRECTRDYTFENDTQSYFTDEYGQPFGVIRQQPVFTQLAIAENDYSISYGAMSIDSPG